jgi:nucleoside-diphosphate-sugar epimerase
MTDTVLVAGGSGFVATHLVSQLLDRGYTVRASVRSLASAAKVEPLRRLGAVRAGRLELFEADLIVGHSRDLALRGGGTSGFVPFCPAAQRGVALIVGQARRYAPRLTRNHHNRPAREGTG